MAGVRDGVLDLGPLVEQVRVGGGRVEGRGSRVSTMVPGCSWGTRALETGPRATSGTARMTTSALTTASAESVTVRPASVVRCCPAGEFSA
jgi:hypothetical protein